MQAPILTMSGSSAEVRVPGTPPDPSCPLIWVRSAVPPYASPTVSCSAYSSIRGSSRSGFQPLKQPASSPLTVCHSSVICWFGGRMMEGIVGSHWLRMRFGYNVRKLCPVFYVWFLFLEDKLYILFGPFFTRLPITGNVVTLDGTCSLFYLLYLNSLRCVLPGSCCSLLFDANIFEHWWRRSKWPILYHLKCGFSNK